jgi:hypothetical protein
MVGILTDLMATFVAQPARPNVIITPMMIIPLNLIWFLMKPSLIYQTFRFEFFSAQQADI